jgi:hypothetical protein
MRKIAAKLAAPAVPIISGTAQVGRALTARGGNGSFQWQREGTAISGATSSSYVLQAADLGALISVESNGVVSALAGPVISTIVYYVSVTDGNDSNNGLSPIANPTNVGGKNAAGPWKTLAAVNAVNLSTALQTVGTSVLFKRGDRWDRAAGPSIVGTLIPSNSSSGSAGKPIVYDAYGTGPNPIIDGSVDASLASDWAASGTPNVWKSVATFPPALVGVATITAANPAVVTITNGAFPPVSYGQSIIFGGTVPAGIKAGQVYYLTDNATGTLLTGSTSGATVYKLSSTPITVTLVNTSGGTTSTTATFGISGLPYNNANDIGNILWGFSPLGGSAPPAAMAASCGKMTGGGGGGIWYNPGDGTNNIGTTQGNWNFNTDNFTVQVYSVGNPATEMPGIRLAMNAALVSLNGLQDYSVFQNITFQYSANSYALGMVNTNTNITFRDLVVQWTGGGNIGGASQGGGTNSSRAGDAITPFGSWSAIMVERAFIYQVYDIGFSPQLAIAGAHDFTVRNSVIAGFGTAVTVDVEPGTGSSTESGVNIYANTFFGYQSWSWNQRPNGNAAVWGARFTDDSTVSYLPNGLNVENNVFAGLGNFGMINGAVHGGVSYPSLYLDSMDPVTFDYNLWHVLSPSNPNVPDGTTTVQFNSAGSDNESLASWIANAATAGFSREAHGLIDLDPQFNNQAGYDFTAAPGSRLRNAGANLYAAGVVWDFKHKPRPISGPFTMGAFQ